MDHRKDLANQILEQKMQVAKLVQDIHSKEFEFKRVLITDGEYDCLDINWGRVSRIIGVEPLTSRLRRR